MKEMEKLELEERGLQIATAAQRIYPIGIDPREKTRTEDFYSSLLTVGDRIPTFDMRESKTVEDL